MNKMKSDLKHMPVFHHTATAQTVTCFSITHKTSSDNFIATVTFWSTPTESATTATRILESNIECRMCQLFGTCDKCLFVSIISVNIVIFIVI